MFKTLDDTGNTYAEALGALNTYIEPKKNIPFERHVFRPAKQQDDETVDNFIVRLSKLSLGCDFEDAQKSDMIRDQVIDCCRSTELRKKLLSEANLTLDRVRTISRIFELSSSHAKQMAEDNQSPEQKQSGDINKLNGARRKQYGPRYDVMIRYKQHLQGINEINVTRVITPVTRVTAGGDLRNVFRGLQRNATGVVERATMAVSVNLQRTSSAETADVVGIVLACVRQMRTM